MLDDNALLEVPANVIWHALHGVQAELAEVNGPARRYRAAVAPFASLDENTADAMARLAELVPVGDAVFLLGDMLPTYAGMRKDATIPLLQMMFPPDRALPDGAYRGQIEELTCSDTAEMMELIAIAFPGYFREQTCLMGRYFGIRERGRLIAMGGERMVLEKDGVRWRELSALATHPEHTGRGLGSALMRHVLAVQRELRAVSFLHVIENNTTAIRLYERFGFRMVRRVELHKLVRSRD